MNNEIMEEFQFKESNTEKERPKTIGSLLFTSSL